MSQPAQTEPTRVIGLLGGIAAGKSTVAGLLAEAGYLILDADREARRVTEEAEIRQLLAERFGREVLGADGALDREAMASLAFSDPRARKDLEAIIHPRVRQRLLAAMQEARDRGQSVVLDVPLLLEGGLIETCDLCIFVELGLAQRQARAAARGWPAGELERREAQQAPLEEKRARSRFTLRNDGSLEATRTRLQAILAELRRDSG